MPLIPEMVWVPLCFTLKIITVMSNINYPVQYTIPVQDLDMDWFREQDWQKASSEAFYFFLAALKARHPSLRWCFATILRPALIRWIDTKHLVAWITIKRIAALIHSFKLRQSENTRRIVNSPNFLFLILKPKNYVRINNSHGFHTGHRPLSPLAFRLSFCKLLFRWWCNQNQRQSLFATSSFSHADWWGR